MKTAIILASVTCALGACSNDRVWSRPGSNLDQLAAEKAACEQAAYSVRGAIVIGNTIAPSDLQVYRTCMMGRGWRLVPKSQG
jgi:hypothetical protein